MRTFDEKSIRYQELAIELQRQQLKKSVASATSFSQKNFMIDKKIEYDQVFFTEGYGKF